MPTIPEPLAAALADRYRIQRELGAGGMATVYLAEDVRHHRLVAVKVLRPELAAALGPERFLREIETTANLRHPHILPLYDSGEAKGFLYYVMPYVEGESLRDRLERERQLPLDDALRIAREVADALSYAHAQGVVHRDIKPANILLERGHAVVADFGIARALGAAGSDRLTQTGMAVGTPTYMSPEQAAGEGAIDGRSDLYSLACVVYEMLAGQPPFTGATAESVVHQHLAADPRPITQIRPAVPAAVAGVLQRALAKSPADRFNPAAQFAEALAAPAGAGPTPRARRTVRWVAAGAIGVAAVAVAQLGRTRGEPMPAIGRTVQITRDPGLEIDPAVSPDGQMIAYAAGPVARLQLFVRQATGGGTAVPLTTDTTRQHRWPRWSPDGSRIAFQSDDGIHVVPALGGPARLVARSDTTSNPLGSRSFSSISGLAWSPDGRRIVFARAYLDEGLWVVSADGGEPARLKAPPEAHSPAWSPDGARIAVVAGNSIFSFGMAYFGNAGQNSLWVVPVDGGEPVRLTDGAHLETSPLWSPDGRYLFWVSDRGGTRDVYRLRVDRGGAARGEPERLTTGLDAHSISLSADGTRLAYASFRTFSNIWTIDVPRDSAVSIAEARPVTTGTQTIEDVDVTRDGQWLTFDADWTGNADIYRMPAAGGEPTPVTVDSADDYSAAWSPDGRRIVFHSFRFGSRDVFTVDADGNGLIRRTSSPAHELDAVWGPDGESILFEVVGRTTQSFTILPLGPGAAERTLLATGDFAQWSPRGDLIVYHGRDGLRVVSADGGESRVLVPNRPGTEPFYAAWSGDGSMVYYLEQGPGGWSIRSVPAAGGPSRLLVRFDDPTRQHTRYGFTTDDRRFWLTLGSHASDVWLLEFTRR